MKKIKELLSAFRYVPKLFRLVYQTDKLYLFYLLCETICFALIPYPAIFLVKYAFDAIDTTKGCLALFTGMLRTMKFNKEVMENSAKHGFTNATDAADYLVNHGVAFRDAHGIVGQLVLYCIEKDIALDDMTLEEYKAISPVFEEDIYEAISMKTCVDKRTTIGAPGKEAMEKVIRIYENYLH